MARERLAHLVRREPDRPELRRIFASLQFKQFLRRFLSEGAKAPTDDEPAPPSPFGPPPGAPHIPGGDIPHGPGGGG